MCAMRLAVTSTVRLAASTAKCRVAAPAVRVRNVSVTRRVFSSQAEEKPAEAEAPAEAAPAASGPTSDQKYIEELKEEIRSLKDQVLRSYAEEENVRRIAKRDVENAKSYANSSFAKALLEVADNLERAIKSVPEDSIEPKDTLKMLKEGVGMTEEGLHKTFLKFGVAKFGAIGDKFDPNMHDALFQIPVVEGGQGTPGTIGQVLKPGYKLHDRVIRAAEVGTFVKA